MKYREILEQVITEINMSPGVLQRLAADIDARAGMEFEMIIPGAGGDEDFESEPDYDQDERIRRLDDIRQFFYDGNFNGRRDVDSLMEQLWEDYESSDWLSEKKQEEWDEVTVDHIRDIVMRDHEEEFREQAEEEAKKQAPEFGMNDEELRDAIEQRFKQLVNDKVEEILGDGGKEYDEAFEEWENEQWQETYNDDDMFTDWLDSEGITHMSEIASRYEITWPHWTEGGEEGEVDIQQVADEFGSFIGRPVNYSRNYHGAKRTTDGYSVEPDGSLSPDDQRDGGLEFISPPLPVNEMFSDLEKVYKWAKRTGAYTNESTGLHINVSVPGWDGDLNKLDYVKLALLLGDEYVLQDFGRAGNTYAKSALQIVKSHIQQRPEDAGALLQQMKRHLNTAAAKSIHTGVTNKYTSINVKGGYIEFRSPGGDWLNEDIEKIKTTLLRFVVAMDAAVNEEKYKDEYAKKLYKLLAPSNDSSDTLQYFTKFSAGELPRSALASFVRQAQLQRNLKKGPTGAKYWWEVSRPDSYASIEVVATSKEEAIEIAKREYPDWNYARNIVAKPLRPYDSSPIKATAGAPQRI
jgi:hypothetical protein